MAEKGAIKGITHRNMVDQSSSDYAKYYHDHSGTDTPMPATSAPTTYYNPIYLDDTLLDDTLSPDNSGGSGRTVGNSPLLIFIFFIILFVAIFVLAILLRDFAGCRVPFRRASASQQLGRGAGSLNSNENRDEWRRRQIEAKQMARKRWYEYYLKPYTMVLTNQTYRSIDPGRETTDEASADVENQRTSSWNRDSLKSEGRRLSEVGSSDDGYSSELETATLSGSDGNEHSHTASLSTVQVWDPPSEAFVTIEPNCSICLVDYSLGDKIVRSAASRDEEHCPHVYHLECMLSWLSKGKKWCPICRKMFVPTLRITDGIDLRDWPEEAVTTESTREGSSSYENRESIEDVEEAVSAESIREDSSNYENRENRRDIET